MKHRRGRPQQTRRVGCDPEAVLFKPAGIPAAVLEHVTISLDELEALRLADREGLYHADAAECMQVSRATFGRIVTAARAKVARALLDGMAIRIEGGVIMQNAPESPVRGHCICPACAERLPHTAGSPCHEQRCPACGKRMLREGAEHHKKLLEKKRGNTP